MTKEIINYDGTLSKQEIESWKEIEEPRSCNSWTRNVPTASHMLFWTFSYIYPCHRKYWARGLFFGALYTISLGSYKNWGNCWRCIFWHLSMSPPLRKSFLLFHATPFTTPLFDLDIQSLWWVHKHHKQVHWVRLQVVNRLELHDWIYNCWMTLGKPIALGCLHFCSF